MEYGKEIKRLRKLAGLAQHELGAKVGIAQYNLSKIEQGIRPIKEADFERILNVFGYELKKVEVVVKKKRCQ